MISILVMDTVIIHSCVGQKSIAISISCTNTQYCLQALFVELYWTIYFLEDNTEEWSTSECNLDGTLHVQLLYSV